MYQNLAISKWLILDEDNIVPLKQAFKFLYWLKPQYFFYLLYCSIPQKEKPPFLHKVEKEEPPKENKLFTRVKETLRWSDRELKLHSRLLTKVITPNEKYWKKELGI
jgi:hypothetical protein